jgi:hypothetical protein
VNELDATEQEALWLFEENACWVFDPVPSQKQFVGLAIGYLVWELFGEKLTAGERNSRLIF